MRRVASNSLANADCGAAEAPRTAEEVSPPSLCLACGRGAISQPPVFSITLPLKLGLTMNEYKAQKPWALKKHREELDLEVCTAMWLEVQRYGKRAAEERLLANGKRRVVEVVRYSSTEPDEFAADTIGGKVPIDRLVHAGIIAGDSRKHIVRQAAWKYAPRGEGRVVINVYEAE